MKKILITGINGFIGKSLRINLIKHQNKFDVWGIDRLSKYKNTYKIDLLDSEDCKKISKDLPFFDVIVHTAAIAHSNSDIFNTYKNNLKITKNLLDYFSDFNTHFIFLSSISVYGEDKRHSRISVNDELRPSTFYGKSKKECEEMILNSSGNVDVLRLCPVYSINKLDDIKKRVFFPLFPFRIEIFPSPDYSLCSLELVSRCVGEIINRGSKNKNIYNILDPIDYKQKEISSCFPNLKIPIFEILFKPLYYFTYLINFKRGYHLRCLYWKLFKSNLYVNNFKEINFDKKELLIDLLKNK